MARRVVGVELTGGPAWSRNLETLQTRRSILSRTLTREYCTLFGCLLDTQVYYLFSRLRSESLMRSGLDFRRQYLTQCISFYIPATESEGVPLYVEICSAKESTLAAPLQLG